ncbi:IMPACT family protein [Leucobacter sp. HY1910]
MAHRTEYETVAGRTDIEIEVSRSRFITRLEQVSDERAARDIIAEVKAEEPRARHHCTAFVLGPDGRVQRSSDDGEPSGTAGAPMLDALVSAGLSDVVAVVTRYFGGVLLGAGGLTRTYRAAVAEAVLVAPRVRRGLRFPVKVTSAYDVAAQIESEARRRGFVVGEAGYTDRVAQEFWVAEPDIDQLTAAAQELSAGVALFETGEPRYVDL